ncbi:MAG: serine/threonine protein kinase [Kofleriaceae bacterium]|nr:serine/threonine protein kinase [Kofleriaceae bacterium]
MFVCPECGRADGAAGYCGEDGVRLIQRDDPLLGATIGRWRVARVLGEGGMGKVYLAVQPAIGSRVAIKVLSEACARDRDLVERFFAEARAVNLIRHEHIIAVLDLAWLDDGRPYIVMEFVDGATLGARVRDGAAPLGGLARVVGEVLSALAAAHARGVIHRDLKPDNVLVTAAGHAKVLDFGIAKLAPGLRAGDSPRTQTGAMLGTPDYMAPEQIAGGAIDGRTDLYATGAMLYESVTGQRPFHADTLFGLLRAHVEAPVPSARAVRPDVPEALDAVIARAMAKRPDDRFASADDMAQALAAACATLPPEAWTPLGRRDGAPPPIGPTPSGAMPLALAPTHAAAPTEKDPATERTRPRRPRGALVAGATVGVGAIAVVAVLASRGGGGAAARGATTDDHDDAAAMVAAAETTTTTTAPAAACRRPRRGRAGACPAVPTLASAAPTGKAAPAAKAGPARADATPGEPPPPAPPAPVEDTTDAADHDPAARTTTTTTTTGGVTIIETHADSFEDQPDYAPKRFDAIRWLPRAQALARKLAGDARLIGFDVDGVGLDGLADLTLSTDFDATYEFRSPAASKRPAGVPRNVDVDIPCRVVVTASARRVEVLRATDEKCGQPLRPRPRCTLAQVWKKAADDGAPTDDVVAQIDYLWDGWFVQVGDDYTSSLPDDC